MNETLAIASCRGTRGRSFPYSEMPEKNHECMGMGIPILHGVEGESARIVLDEAVGVTFEPENAADLVDKLTMLAADPDYRHGLSAAGPTAASHYDRQVLARTMLATLADVAQRRKR